MRFSIRFADQIVGTLVILALALLILVIFMLGRNQRWFVNDPEYITYFDSASGISPNMAVQHMGFTIGHVKKISLADDDRVEVIFSIFEEYAHRVTEGSIVEIQSSLIPGFGNAFIFHPGSGNRLISAGDEPPEISSLRATDNIDNIIKQVNSMLEMLNISLSGSDGAQEHTLGQVVTGIDTTIANINTAIITVNTTIASINQFLRTVSDPSGTVMSILDGQGSIYQNIDSSIASIAQILDTDGELVSGIEQTISSLARVIENLERTSEFIPAQLPQIGVLINDLNLAVRTAQDILISASNLPFLRSGIPERREIGPGGASPRNLEF
jgi:phospholipid/cholesterol/gamma-HCH transport system substrate-binding protein